MITIFLKTANILKNSPTTNADIFPSFLSIVLEAIFWPFFSNSYRVYTSNIDEIFRSSHIFSYQTLISKASEITPKKQLMSRWVSIYGAVSVFGEQSQRGRLIHQANQDFLIFTRLQRSFFFVKLIPFSGREGRKFTLEKAAKM